MAIGSHVNKMPNKPTAPNPAEVPQIQVKRPWRQVGESDRLGHSRMSDEQSKQPPLSERVFDYWFITLPWLAILILLFVFVGIPLANMLVVCWVKGTDAYFHQGIRIPLGHKLHFSDGSKVPQWPLVLTHFPIFIIIAGVPTFAMLRILRFYEQRKKKGGDDAA